MKKSNLIKKFLKNKVKFISAFCIASTLLTMPVFAADVVSAVSNVENIVRTIGGSLIGIAAVYWSLKDFLRRAWLQAIVILVIGGFIAFAIGAPDVLKSMGQSLGTAITG